MKVAIDDDEPLWTVNFKRALVAQLQLQIDASSPVFHKGQHDADYKTLKAQYHTIEVKYSLIYQPIKLLNN